MYAIIETGSKQYKVSQGDVIEVELLEAKRHVTFDHVLLVSDGSKVDVGAPYVKGAKVSAKVLGNGKDDKVTTFKYKCKVNYHRTKGHRQPYTQLEIDKIEVGG